MSIPRYARDALLAIDVADARSADKYTSRPLVAGTVDMEVLSALPTTLRDGQWANMFILIGRIFTAAYSGQIPRRLLVRMVCLAGIGDINGHDNR